MVTSSKVDAALDTLAQYREEGVILQSALDDLRAQPAALDRLIARLDSSRPDALVDGFVALRQHFAHTRAQIDVAIDFLDKAVEELGGTPPYDGKAGDHRELAEEGP
jgi:hypothetical protein